MRTNPACGSKSLTQVFYFYSPALLWRSKANRIIGSIAQNYFNFDFIMK
jgi:hypothetical protein